MDFNHTIYDHEEVYTGKPYLDKQVQQVASELQNSIEIQDRIWFLKTHRQCFIGKDITFH